MSLPDPNISHDDDQFIRIKREAPYVWLARLLWVIGLILLLEYTLASRQEREPQAALTAGAIFGVLLLAGIIFEVVRHVESQPESRLLREMAKTHARQKTHDAASETTTILDTHIADNAGD